VCQKIGKGPGKKGNPVYNTVQCGHAPYNNAGDEDPGCCPGRVDQGAKGCDVLGPKWDLSVFGGGGGGGSTKPAAPTSLTASVNKCSVSLTWKDNANNETGYNVRRKVVGGTFETVAVLAANSKSYTDNTVKANTNYEYRAQAFNDVGTAGSNIVKASVKSCTGGGGGSTVEINVTLVETDCNKKGKTRNKILFTVVGSSAKPKVNKGFLINKGGNNWLIRHVGTPKGTTTTYVITVGDAVHEEAVTSVTSCAKSFNISGMENNNLNEIEIFPNPANGQVTLLLNGQENVRVQLMNISGQVVFEQTVENDMTNISLNDYTPGTYMFKITNNENTEIRKFIIR
ncbi:MAG: T9SS type A sorting domain-containing protein, partial [Bacteroidales bacterium]|nr:T9SS type A sorting domain-containing protein [Bacteroidales bacterium]